MQQNNDICDVIRQLRVPASAELDARVREAISEATHSGKAVSRSDEPTFPQVLRTLMKMKSTRYGIGAAMGVALLAALILHQSTTSAWAIGDAIKALQKYTAVRMTGYTTAGDSPAFQALFVMGFLLFMLSCCGGASPPSFESAEVVGALNLPVASTITFAPCSLQAIFLGFRDSRNIVTGTSSITITPFSSSRSWITFFALYP